MKIEPKTLKGFRDFLPEDARKRQYVIDKLRSVFESYGFEPLETPALEYEEILSGKYGDEGDKLMYRFEDNGGRRVALRYDQTVPLARVVAQYQDKLPLPFKRYQISNVWRGENTQAGRFREFMQCDIDTVGTSSPLADAEVIKIASTAISALGLKDFKILINDRDNFSGYDAKVISMIDKLKKIGEEGVKKELRENGFDENYLEKIQKKEASENLKKIISLTSKLNPELESKIVYESTLARGLDYYTGVIFEIEIEGYDSGSVCGGGRYDNLVGMFSGSQVPAVGCAFGFNRLIEALEALALFPKVMQKTKVLVINSGEERLDLAIKVCEKLNEANISQELYVDTEAKPEKQFKYAEKKNIPYVVVPTGDDKVELRSKKDGKIEKEELTLDALIDKLR